MKSSLALIFSILAINFALAQTQSSGLQLLEMGPTAAELSISEAAVATPNGASSIYANPALLVMDNQSSISLGYTSWVADANNLFGGINFINDRRAIAFSFYTSGVAGFEQRNNPGESNGDFSLQYLSISGAYSYDFKIFTAGVAAHYLNEDIYLFRANGYAVNFGLASSFSDNRIRIGASILNVGEMEKLDQSATELPSSFNAGIAVDVLEFVHFKSPELPILATFMIDYVRPFDEGISNSQNFIPDEPYFNLGLNLLVSQAVEIRAGYKTQENVRPTSFGLGFIADRVIFNYAIVPFNTGFGTVHSIGLQYQL